MNPLSESLPLQEAWSENTVTSMGFRAGRVLVYIPTLNDCNLLHELATGVRALDDNVTVLIIDDGSRPSIERSTLPDGCLLFSLPSNAGLGVCTHIALDHALAHGYEFIVRLDADGQHPVPIVLDLLKPLRDGSADITVGIRTNHGNHSERDAVLRRLVKWYFTFLANLITAGAAPSDVSSGFFAANRRAMQELNNIMLERYPEPQLYSHACRSGLRVQGTDVEQAKRQHGRSNITYVDALSMIYRFTVYVIAEILNVRR
jgi:glycosyltransferase involved in cell wall biosynthesis